MQNLRKQADFDVSQHIVLTLACDGTLGEVASDPALAEIIARETLANGVRHVSRDVALQLAHQKEDTIEGERVVIGIEAAQ